MIPITKREEKIVLGATAASVATVLVMNFAIIYPHELWSDILVWSILLSIFAVTAIGYLKRKWVLAIEAALPDFVRDIAESQKAGMPLLKSIEEASKRIYGPLSDELKKVLNAVSWGKNLEEALADFANRVPSPLVSHIANLLIGAHRSGGDIERVMLNAATFIREYHELQREKYAKMRPYVTTIFVAFFVFLAVVAIMVTSFFPAFAEAGGAPGMLAIGGMPIEQFKTLMYHVVIIQGLLSGLVAGKMGEGTVTAGLKYSAVMIAIGYVVFRLI